MFQIDTSLIFWTTISFLAMVLILYKFVFPPLLKVLDQRKIAIEERLKQAEQAKIEAENLLKKYQSQVDEAAKKTALMFEEASRKSEALRTEMVKVAQHEALSVIEGAKKDIEAFKKRAMVDYKEDIARIIVEVANRLIKKSLKVEDQIKLIETSIKDIEKNAAGKT